MRWPDGLIARVDAAAKDTNRTRSEFIRDAVEKVLEHHVYEEGLPEDDPMPAPIEPVEGHTYETCPHSDTHKVDDVTTCRSCGATRPYFSWLPPE